MCTLIALHRCVPGAALIVAANRDEYLDRPCEGPALRATPGGPVLAPLDRRAGGTWLGLNASGLFVGLTNRPSPVPDPTRRSRGLLVLETLAAPAAGPAARALARLPRRVFNPFNLLLADGEQAFAVVYEEVPRVLALEPGVHVLGNGDPNAARPPKVGRVRSEAATAAGQPPARVLDALATICRRHEDEGDPLASPCVHAGGFGTRSSTLLRLGAAGGELRHAEGAPCRTPYQDFTGLLTELGRGAGLAPRAGAARRAS